MYVFFLKQTLLKYGHEQMETILNETKYIRGAFYKETK